MELGSSVEGIRAIPKKSCYDSHHQRKWGLDNLCVHKMALSLPRLKHRCSDAGLSSDAACVELSLDSGGSIMPCLLMRLAFFLAVSREWSFISNFGKTIHASTYEHIHV